MIRRLAALLPILLLAVTTGGCSFFQEAAEVMNAANDRLEYNRQEGEMPPQAAMVGAMPDVDLISMSHSVADALVGELRKNHPTFRRNKPLLITTFVNRNNLDSSSELGMVVADQIASRFTQHGYAMVETRLRQELAIRENQGEFILSRDLDNLSREYQAYAVIVGNYTQGRDELLLTTRIIQIKNKQVLASVDAKVPLGDRTRDLLIDTSCCDLRVVDQ